MRRVYQVAVRAADRAVLQHGTGLYRTVVDRAEGTGPDGEPVVLEAPREELIAGVACPEGCVIEEVADETMAAIHAAQPPHGGGVILSADHTSVTAAPEPEGYQAELAERAERQAVLEEVRAHAQANPDDMTAKLAKALGLV